MKTAVITGTWSWDLGTRHCAEFHWRGQAYVAETPRQIRRPQELRESAEILIPVPRWMKPWEVVK